MDETTLQFYALSADTNEIQSFDQTPASMLNLVVRKPAD